jgi:hypothetical protein
MMYIEEDIQELETFLLQMPAEQYRQGRDTITPLIQRYLLAKHAASQAEDEIGYEFAFLCSTDGEEREFLSSSKRYAVDLPPYRENVKWDFYHNHPPPTPLSLHDIGALLTHNFNSITAYTTTGDIWTAYPNNEYTNFGREREREREREEPSSSIRWKDAYRKLLPTNFHSILKIKTFRMLLDTFYYTRFKNKILLLSRMKLRPILLTV